MILLILLFLVIALSIVWTAENPNKYYISNSKIHGKGVMAARDFVKDEFIDVGIKGIFVTNGFGNMINHSSTPNAYLRRNGINYDVHATNIKKDDEITLNYNDAPWFIDGPGAHFK